ncbi:NAD(P)/FAD-dependent oxidoreductase [Microtetraspora malaysiensis]|uniref:NAD(P)/FAD-dependent oxidoreductase n=1 Tax=Microtetraspora malaysiensis TaxID=161358 RepID=UPI003D8E0BBD
MQSIAVVGASLAGVTAAEALREEGFDGVITLVGQESCLPYDRPPLSKQAIQGAEQVEPAGLRTRAELDALDVRLRLGVRASSLAPASAGGRHRIGLADGDRLDVDGVILATGARARSLPFTEPATGVHLLRTYGDAVGIRRDFERRPRVVVVGAGFLGMEVAASARAHDLDVTVLEAADLPMVGPLGRTLGRWAEAVHRQRGVRLMCGVQVAGFVGTTRLQGLVLADGTLIEADMAVVAVGAEPNTAWLDGSGIEFDGGVVCDEHCATRVDGIFAAGDVARYFSPRMGKRVRSEHWANAVEQGRVAARNLLRPRDRWDACQAVPYFWSDQYDVKIQFVGERLPDQEAELVEGSYESGRFGVVFRHGDTVTGAMAANLPAFAAKHRRLLKSRYAATTTQGRF